MTDHHGHAGGHGGHGEHDTVGVHGMLLVGQEEIYLSHLPMFMHPHNFQVILEVGFDDTVREVLRADSETSGDDLHTFAPERFPITELEPSGGGPARTSIKGTIFHGHFERGGRPIAQDVTAEVRTVAYFAELDIKAQHAPDRTLTYLCFGRGGRLHLAHQITASPDFDQVLTARLVPGTVTDPAGRPVDGDVTSDFERAAPAEFRGREDTPDARLNSGDLGHGFFFASFGPSGSHGFGVQVDVGKELYLELAELGS